MIKKFFYDKNKFQPVYFWIAMFLVPTIVLYWIKIITAIFDYISTGKINISDTLLLGILAFIQVWLGIFNWRRNKKSEIEKFNGLENDN
jgi:type VI protein secretion system component VasK